MTKAESAASRTPRTDAFEDAHTQYDNEVFIGYQAEFCRALEIEAADLRERLAEAQSGAGAWMKFAVHQEHCQTCGEAVSDCEIGTTLKAAALKGADHE